MNYEQIKYRIPEGLPRKKRKQRPMGPKSVLLFFLVTMILFAVLGSIVQYALGMIGVLITEIGFLLLSVLYVLWKGHRIRDVFPIRKPRWTAAAGTIVMWIGGYLLMFLLNLLVIAYIPDFPVNNESELFLSFDLNWFLLFFIVAVTPPICEEAMHRGVIQYGLRKKISSPWVMALVIGLIFGIFHLDPSKFAATAILGGIMGWIMFRTDNMVYSSLFHFVHNGSQIILLAFSSAAAILPGAGRMGAAFLPFAKTVRCCSGAGMTSFLTGTLGLYPVFLDGAQDVIDVPSNALLLSAGILTVFLGVLIPPIMYAGNYLLMKDTAPRRPFFVPKDREERRKLEKKFLMAFGCFWAVGVFTIILAVIIG